MLIAALGIEKLNGFPKSGLALEELHIFFMENEFALQEVCKRYFTHLAEMAKKNVEASDCIDEWEELLVKEDKTIKAQDPLLEVDIGEPGFFCLVYVSTFLQGGMKDKLVNLIKEYKDCFAGIIMKCPVCQEIL